MLLYLLLNPLENLKRKRPVWRPVRREERRHIDLLNWQRSSTVKSLSFKWEFFLLKIRKNRLRVLKMMKRSEEGDGGFTQKQKGKNSPLFLYSRKLLWDNVLQKIEAKKENLRKRSRFGWENTAAEHESLRAAGFRPDNKQTEFMANCDRMTIFANCLHIWENIIMRAMN